MRWAGGGRALEVWSETDAWLHSPGRAISYAAPDVPGYGGTDGQHFMRSFLRAIRGEEPPLVGIGDLMRVLEVIEGAYRAASSGTATGVGGAVSHA
jgi:predicted dehydrogenase